MKIRKTILLVVLSLVLSACTSVNFRGDDSLESRARRNPRYFPKIVSTLPDGFISHNDAMKDMDGIITTLFWKTTYNVYDAEGVLIFSTDVHDDSFIVIYNNQLCICGYQFSQISDKAMSILEYLNRKHSVGEAIEIRGRPSRTTYTITVASVERLEKDTVAVYEINFSISPNVDSRYVIGFFEAAVLKGGNRVYDFVLINEEKVTVELSSTEFLEMLILNVPRGLQMFFFQNSTRMVSLQ